MLFSPDVTIPAQILAIVVLFASPQSVQAQLLGAVNSVFFGAIPLVLAHWGVRILGGTILPTRTADSPRSFATNAAAAI